MVIDTMVFAYALLGVTDHRETALAVLERADPIVVPDSLYAELTNVAWQWARQGGVAATTALSALTDAQALITRSLPTPRLWSHALALAIEADHPAYDTLFVAAAAHEGTRVISFDQALLAAFPSEVQSPAEFLGIPGS